MTDHRDKNSWEDFAHTVEVVAGAAWSQDDLHPGKSADSGVPGWGDFAHSSEVLLASAVEHDEATGPSSSDRGCRRSSVGWPRRQTGMGVAALCACFTFILVGHLSHQEIGGQPTAVPVPQLASAKRLELVNASHSSSIVRVRLTAPGRGIVRVIDLADPIPPASIQQFRLSLGSGTSVERTCLVFFSASYASGVEADFPDLDLCRDNQILALESSGTSPVRVLKPFSDRRAIDAPFTEALIESLDLHADRSRSIVRFAKFNADGSKIATLAEGSGVQLWESSTGRLIAVLAGNGPAIEGVTFSPDGREVVTLASDRTAQRWAAGTGHELSRYQPRQATGEDYALGRSVLMRPDASSTGERLTQAGRNRSLRQLRTGSTVQVVQAYGPWTLVSAGADFGYVPSDALVKGTLRQYPGILIAGASQSEGELTTLEHSIDDLRSAGRYAEAGALATSYIEAVKVRYGSEHPRYAGALDIQAQLAQTGSRLSEAGVLYRRALAIREKTLRACDPEIMRNLGVLVELYRAQGRLDLSDPLLRRSQSSCPR